MNKSALVERAKQIAMSHYGTSNSMNLNPESDSLDNFNGAGGARPGFKMIPVAFGFNVDNDLTARKDVALSAGAFASAANLATAGISCDALFGDGAVITSLTFTAADSKLTCDQFLAYLKSRRMLVERIEIQTDNTAQLKETITHVVGSPFKTEKQDIVRISRYKSVNQNATTEVEMVLKTKSERFWMGPDDIVTVGISKSSDSNFIIAGLLEVPA